MPTLCVMIYLVPCICSLFNYALHLRPLLYTSFICISLLWFVTFICFTFRSFIPLCFHLRYHSFDLWLSFESHSVSIYFGIHSLYLFIVELCFASQSIALYLFASRSIALQLYPLQLIPCICSFLNCALLLFPFFDYAWIFCLMTRLRICIRCVRMNTYLLRFAHSFLDDNSINTVYKMRE